MRVPAALAAVVLVVTVLAPGAAADEGDRDPAFGPGGQAELLPLARTLLLPDDRVVEWRAVPPADPTGRSSGWELRRHLPDGPLDPTFGDGGVVHVTTTAGPGGWGVDGAGRLVLLGSFDNNAGQTVKRSFLLRLLPSGDLDPAYGADGRVELDSTIYDPDGFGAVAPDGSVYVRRTGGGSETSFRRVDARGVVDPSFADAGVLRIPGFVDLTAATADRLVAVGTNLSEQSIVATYTLDGRGVSWAVFDLIVVSAVVQPDGSVVIADRPAFHRLHRADGTPDERLILQRVLPNGRVDTSFGDGGQVDTGTRGYYDAIAGGPDGRLYAWSSFAGFVRAFTPDGHPIAPYGDCGWGGRGVPRGAVLGVDHHGRVLVIHGDGGSTSLLRLQGDDGGPHVDAAPDSQTWVVAADGLVADLGLACPHGDVRGIPLNQPVVGIAATATGDGYWLAAADGGVFSFGDAVFHGSLGGVRLNAPVVAIAATPTGGGYWLVAGDGGVFAFGDAGFFGSLGAYRLRSPIVGMTPRRSGRGYWLVGRDGGVFTFGDAPFAGADPTGGVSVGVAPTATDAGYWVLHADGGPAPFGDATVPNDRGSEVYSPAYSPGRAVAIAPTVAAPGFIRLFTSCCPEQLGGRLPVGWDVR
jgi:hypothetical protein